MTAQVTAKVCTAHAILRSESDTMILHVVTPPRPGTVNALKFNLTDIHRCNGTHTTLGPGITLHHCDCGASFYAVRDAVRALVNGLANLQAQVEHIEHFRTEEFGD